jgi:hypothetical protein
MIITIIYFNLIFAHFLTLPGKYNYKWEKKEKERKLIKKAEKNNSNRDKYFICL